MLGRPGRIVKDNVKKLLALICRILIFCNLVFCVFLSAGCVFAGELKEITILSMNDFHAQFYPSVSVNNELAGGAAMIAGYVDHYKKKQNNVIWVVSGDFFKGSALDTATKGKASIEILNRFPPDAFALGNHEFDWGLGVLGRRMKEAKFPFICANLTLETDNRKYFTQPYLIKEINGVKVLFVGVIMEKLDNFIGKNNAKGLRTQPTWTAM